MPLTLRRLFRPGSGRAALAGLGFALAYTLAFPPVGFWPAVFLGPLPFFILVLWAGDRRAGGDRSLRPASLAFWAGAGTLPFWLLTQNWVTNVSALGYVPMCAVLAFLCGLFVWAGVRVRASFPRVPALLALPVLWVAAEAFRGEIAFEGYPWYLAAHPLIDAFDGLLAMPAALAGTYFVSLLAAIPAAVGVSRIARSRRADLAVRGGVLAALLVGWPLLGRALLPPAPEATADIAVVQTNFRMDPTRPWTPADRLADWSDAFELILEAGGLAPDGEPAGEPPDLIVLPESGLPADTLDEAALAPQRDAGLNWPIDAPGGPTALFTFQIADELRALQRLVGVPMLVNAGGYDAPRLVRTEGGYRLEADARHNSVFLVRNARVEARYDKLRLTPFGEVMPYISASDWLEDRLLALGAAGRTLDLAPGAEPLVFEVPTGAGSPLRLATPICFEATEGDLCRTLAFAGGRRRADLLINQTNDGWFRWWDPGRATHLLTARWRSIELATPMVRAANTGISGVIDARGRVLATLEPRRGGVLRCAVPLGSAVTPYARSGDWLPRGAMIAAVAAILGSFFVRPPQRPEPIPEGT